MTVGKCKDFKHPEGFGFSGSVEGRVPVRGHFRQACDGGPVRKAKGGQLSDAFNPAHKGRLHRALNVPAGKKIPGGKMEQALHSDNAHVQHMAQAAENMARARGRARGGKVDAAQDKAMIKKAVRQHEDHEHDGEHTKLKLRSGGRPVFGRAPAVR